MLLFDWGLSLIFSGNFGRGEMRPITVDLASFDGLTHERNKFKIKQNKKNFEFKFNILNFIYILKLILF